MIDPKSKEQKKVFLNKLVFQDIGILTDFIESKNNYFLVLGREVNSKYLIALVKDNKIIWKNNQLNNIVHSALSNDGSYCVLVTQLQEKEMPLDYRSGGHIYLITKEGKVREIQIPCDGLSCSISPDNKNFGITTMGPEWGGYYFNNEGKLIWKKKFDNKIGGIELKKDKMFIYKWLALCIKNPAGINIKSKGFSRVKRIPLIIKSKRQLYFVKSVYESADIEKANYELNDILDLISEEVSEYEIKKIIIVIEDLNKEIKDMIKQINAKEVIPIHTEHPNMFSK